MRLVASARSATFIVTMLTNRAGDDPDRWLAGAAEHHGSWWPQWIEWLIARSGPEKKPPSALGNRKYPSLGPAPGTYVHQ